MLDWEILMAPDHRRSELSIYGTMHSTCTAIDHYQDFTNRSRELESQNK